MFQRSTTRSRVIKRVGAGVALALLASTVPLAANAANTTSSAASKPTVGGDIKVGIFDRVLTTCFSPNVPNSALGVMKSVYEGLVERRSDGEYVPFLASAITPSSDYKTWTLKVRPNIKFSSGEALDAAAVALNLNALAGKVHLAAAQKGGAALHTLGSGVPFTANLKAVTALSTDTVQMDLWTPQIDWLETLYASGRFYMRAPSTIADATKCANAGVGTGPFVFSSVTPELVKVTRNANYWRKDKAGTQLPYLNSITFRYIEQATQRLNGLKSSSLDAAQFTSAGEVKQVVTVQETKNLSVINSADTFFPTFWLNQAIEPFNNKNARLAFAHAWDVGSFYKLRNCFKGKCLGALPTSIVGPKNIMYNKAGFLKFDTKKSKEFQDAYFNETGKKLTVQLVATTSADSKANAQAVKTILKKAGIESTLLVEDGATQVANAFPGPTQVAAGKFNPYQAYSVLLFEGEGTGFILPFLSPNVFREPGNDLLKVVPTFIAFGVGLNVTRHTDATLSGLLWSAKQDITSARTAKLKAVTKYVQENAVVVPTPTLSYTYAFNSKIKGFDKFTLAAGGAGIPMTNAGVNWTGVYIQK